MKRSFYKRLTVWVCLILIIFLFSSVNNFCQDGYGSISGKITDTSTNEGLPNLNIYFSRTTLGTSSDYNGMYNIKNLPVGEYTLVVSMIGYETKIKKIEIINNSTLTENIFLKPKAIELDEIEIIGDKSLYENYLSEQNRYREIFKKYFLGHTEFSQQCIIQNENKIKFEKTSPGIIEAKCSEPIVVINTALGYKVDCVLKSFSCDYIMGRVQMLFYPKFTEMESPNEDQIQHWKENREKAYLSSLHRFLLSVINNDIQQHNYGLNLTTDNFNVNNIPRAKVLFGSENIAKVDSVTNQITLSFNGYLLVHNNRTEETSWLYLPFGESKLEQDGYVENPLTLTVYNSFAKQGIADLLPDNLQFDDSY